MNKVYKVIWNKTKHCYEVVSELAKSQGKSSQDKRLQRISMRAAAVMAAFVLTAGIGAVVPAQAADTAAQTTKVEQQSNAKAKAAQANDPGNTIVGNAKVTSPSGNNITGAVAVGGASIQFDPESAVQKQYNLVPYGWGMIAAGDGATLKNSYFGVMVGAKGTVENSPFGVAVGGSNDVSNSYAGTALGSAASAINSSGGTALGAVTKVIDSNNSVALGAGSMVASRDKTVSVGRTKTDIEAYNKYVDEYNKKMDELHNGDEAYHIDKYNPATESFNRTITGVAAGTADNDAVTVGQVKAGYVAYDTNNGTVTPGSVTFKGTTQKINGNDVNVGTKLNNVNDVSFTVPTYNQVDDPYAPKADPSIGSYELKTNGPTITGYENRSFADAGIVPGSVKNSWGGNNIVLGQSASSDGVGNGAIVIGKDATAVFDNKFDKGTHAKGTETTVDSISIGTRTKNYNSFSGIALGGSSGTWQSNWGTAVGSDSHVDNSHYGTALGTFAKVQDSENSLALGRSTYVYGQGKDGQGSVALGAFSVVGNNNDGDEVVSVGHKKGDANRGGTYGSDLTRRIINVKAGKEATDAVNYQQLQGVEAKADNANQGFTVSIAQPDGKTVKSHTYKPGETVTVTGKNDNILASVDDKGVVNVNLNDNVKVKTVSVSDDITLGGKSFVKAGIIPGTVTGKSENSTVIGTGANVTNSTGSVALGQDATVDMTNVPVEEGQIGRGPWNGIAIGNQSKVLDSMNGVTVGAYSDITKSNNSVAVGPGLTVKDSEDSVTLGHTNHTYTSDNAVVIGSGYKTKDGVVHANEAVNADKSVVIGYANSVKDTKNGIAVGNESKVSRGENNIALGTNANVWGGNSIALGANTENGKKGSVALGSDSKVSDDYQVSVGNDTLKRKIVNVADGAITEGSHEAVTGGQLAAAGIIPGKTNNDKNYGSTQIAIGQGSVNEAEKGTTIGAGASVAQGASESVALGANSKVTWNDVNATGTLEPRGVVSVGQSGKDGFTRRIINVTAGKDDTDAVNVAQLNEVKSVADNAVQYDDNTKNSVTFGGNSGTTLANVNDVLVKVKGGSRGLVASGITPGAVYSSADGWAEGAAADTGSLAIGGGLQNSYTTAATVRGKNSVAIGSGSKVTVEGAEELPGYNNFDQANGVAVGVGANVTGIQGTAVGYGATVKGNQGTAFGDQSQATANKASAFGESAVASASNSLALGQGARVGTGADNSVALGAGSTAYKSDLKGDYGVVSVGSGTTTERRLIHVADGIDDSDAATVGQLNNVKGNVSTLTDNAVQYDDKTKNSVTFKGEKGTTLNNVNDITFWKEDIYHPDTPKQLSFRASGLVPGEVNGNATGVTVIGNGASVNSTQDATAIGRGAYVGSDSTFGQGSVALGAGSSVSNASAGLPDITNSDTHGVVSVGSSDPIPGRGFTRRIINVTDGRVLEGSHDAVTGGQLFTEQDVRQKTDQVFTDKFAAYEKAGIVPGKITLPNKDVNSNENLALGKNASISTKGENGYGSYNTVVGTNAQISNESKDDTDQHVSNSTVFGAEAKANGNSTSAFGSFAEANGDYAAAFGNTAKAQKSGATALGTAALAQAGESTALGHGASAYSKDSVALGSNASVGDFFDFQGTTAGSVALGTNSAVAESDIKDTDTNGVVSVGSTDNFQRRIINVADGVNDFDAVNKRQLDAVDKNVTGLAEGAVQYDKNKDGSTNYDSVTLKGNNGTALKNVSDIELDGKSFKDAGFVPGTAYGIDNIAIGNGAVGLGNYEGGTNTESIAIGSGALVTGDQSVALGHGAQVSAGAGSVAIGDGAQSRDYLGGAVAIGKNAYATYDYQHKSGQGVAIGADSFAEGNVVSFGHSATDINPSDNSKTYGTDLNRKLIHVANGNVTSDSTDAVNGGQLHAEQEARTAADKAFSDKFAAYENAGVVAGETFGKDSLALGKESLAGANALAVGQHAQAVNNSAAVGQLATANGDNSLALGNGAVTTGTGVNSVALGNGSYADEANVVSVGGNGVTRKITNVTAGTADTDAVNVKQLNDSVGTATKGVVKWDTDNNGNYVDGTLRGVQFKGNGDINATINGVHVDTTDGSLPNSQKGDIVLGTAANPTPDDVINVSAINRNTQQISYNDQTGTTVSGVSFKDGDIYLTNNGVSRSFKDAGLLPGHAFGDEATVIGEKSTANAHGVALGYEAHAYKDWGTALGEWAQANAEGAVALGSGSIANEAHTVSVGSGKAGSPDATRRITNVTAGINDTDAVNKSQLENTVSTATKGVVHWDNNEENTSINGVGLKGNGDLTATTATIAGLGFTNGANPYLGANFYGPTLAANDSSVTFGSNGLALVGPAGSNGYSNTLQLTSNGTTATGDVMITPTANGNGTGNLTLTEGKLTVENGGLDATYFGATGDYPNYERTTSKVKADGDGVLLSYKFQSDADPTQNVLNQISLDKTGAHINGLTVGAANESGLSQIHNVADGVAKTDAATVGQLESATKGSVKWDNPDKPGTINGVTVDNGKVTANNGISAGNGKFNVDDQGNLSVGDKFKVDASTGNTTVGGDLNVGGALKVNGENVATSGDVNAVKTDVSGIKTEIGVDKDGNYSKIENGATSVIAGINQNTTAIQNNAKAISDNTKLIAGDDSKLTLSNGGKTVEEGINNNTQSIKDNAAAIQQNQTAIGALGGAVVKLDDRVDRVGAGAAALAALHPLDYDPDNKLDFAAGYGNYKGASAVSIGTYYRPNETTMFSLGGSFGGGENMVNAGVSFKLGSGSNGVGTSKAAMAKEITDLKADNKALNDKVAAQDKELQDVKAMLQEVLKNQKAGK